MKNNISSALGDNNLLINGLTNNNLSSTAKLLKKLPTQY